METNLREIHGKVSKMDTTSDTTIDTTSGTSRNIKKHVFRKCQKPRIGLRDFEKTAKPTPQQTPQRTPQNGPLLDTSKWTTFRHILTLFDNFV